MATLNTPSNSMDSTNNLEEQRLPEQSTIVPVQDVSSIDVVLRNERQPELTVVSSTCYLKLTLLIDQ